MECFPAVIVHGLGDAVAALAKAAADGTGVTLLSDKERRSTPAVAGGGRWSPRLGRRIPRSRARIFWTARTQPDRQWPRCGSDCSGSSCGLTRRAATPSWRSRNRWADLFWRRHRRFSRRRPDRAGATALLHLVSIGLQSVVPRTVTKAGRQVSSQANDRTFPGKGQSRCA